MKKIYRIIVLFVMATLFANAQVTVNGGPTLTYTSLNTAFAAINAGTHFGAITIDITGNTIEGVTGYAPTPLLASGQSLANYSSIVIRPTVQATVSGSPATGRGVIELDGADNVTIDGDIVAGPVQKDLTFNHTGLNSLAATAVIRFIGRTTLGLGATNNTVTNCVIIGNTEGYDGISGSTVVNSYGIYFGSNVASLATGGLGDNYDNNVISNNEIKKAYFGIWLGGTTANPADNNLISGNTIGSNTAGETVSFGGIGLSSLVTSTITQNEIFNLKLNTSVNNYGIQIAGSSSSSVTISRNRIHGIHSLSTSGFGAYGINLTAGSGHLVVNNVIYDLMTTNNSSTTLINNAFGIRITSGTGIGVYYNSVNLYGQINLGTSSSVGSSAFAVTSTGVTGLEVKNNIFNNTQTTTVTTVATKKFMAVWFPTSYNFLNANLDNNAYTVTNDADHFVGKVGLTNNVNEGANLSNWQALSQVNNLNNDVNSGPVFNFPAPFTSNTNLTFAANTNFFAESGAVLIPALGTNIDHNANVRPLAGINPNTAPDMGAYEFDGINGFPTD
ncbi:MAG: right-handed parallel beta-helix repeat-containing protein, partial [Bacteroidia bacterium]|nr:right-handed parallel beta-helix repeat-containing protein [Bacteroidia bacterium]